MTYYSNPINILSFLWEELKSSIREKKGYKKFIYIFWLFGPFILLIERTPADIWLSVISISFIFKVIIERDLKFFREIWVKSILLFWIYCLCCSLISPLPHYSFMETLVWVRFPIFAIAVSVWIANDQKSINSIILSTFIAILLMMIILSGEILLKGIPSDCRLTWPYGDKVSGNYFAKIGLPILIIAVVISNEYKNRFAIYWAFLIFLMFFFSAVIGERMNFLILFCGMLLSSLFWKLDFKKYLIFIFFLISSFYFFAQNNYCMEKKISSKTVIKKEVKPFYSDYLSVMGGGYLVFKENPVFGIGPANYRELSQKYLKNYPNYRADNHPHNFYIQLAAETGIIGLILGTTMMFTIIYHSFNKRKLFDNKTFIPPFFVIPVAFFWPLASTADFFGQWNNLFVWTSISLALAARNYKLLQKS